jgi:uncharacterized phage-associated protein
MSDSVDGDQRTDREELEEVIKAFLNKYTGPDAGLSEFRIHKHVFFGEIYSLHEYGYRLTDASFKPYFHGSYSEDINEILDEMEGVTQFESRYADEAQYRATEEAKLSSEKLAIVDEVHEQVKHLSSEALGQFTKGTWLYENNEFDTQMDFEEYKDEVLMSPVEWRDIEIGERNPVEEDVGSVAELVE